MDKGDQHFGCHEYAAIYRRLFSDFGYKNISVREIGLLNDRLKGSNGKSSIAASVEGALSGSKLI